MLISTAIFLPDNSAIVIALIDSPHFVLKKLFKCIYSHTVIIIIIFIINLFLFQFL